LERTAFQINMDALPPDNEVENEKARSFYIDECARSNWSTRQLEHGIYSVSRFLLQKLIIFGIFN